MTADEIDKAPRDVPNDIPVEIERMQFDLPELARDGRPLRVALGDRRHHRHRPIVVFTSNSKKALPEPFLRRCVFHHLAFPPFDRAPGDDDQVSVAGIVAARLGARYQNPDRGGAGLPARVKDALSFAEYLRLEQSRLARRPTLAELLDWLDHLMPQWQRPAEWRALHALADPDTAGTAPPNPQARTDLEQSIAALLLKDKTDQGRAGALLDDWRKWRRDATGRRG